MLIEYRRGGWRPCPDSSLEGRPLASLSPSRAPRSMGVPGPRESAACVLQGRGLSRSLDRNWFRAGRGAEPAPWTPGERVARPLASACHSELPRLDASVLFCWEVCPPPLPEPKREAYL